MSATQHLERGRHGTVQEGRRHPPPGSTVGTDPTLAPPEVSVAVAVVNTTWMRASAAGASSESGTSAGAPGTELCENFLHEDRGSRHIRCIIVDGERICTEVGRVPVREVVNYRILNDGDPYGVITAYCVYGDTTILRCPDWVNRTVPA